MKLIRRWWRKELLEKLPSEKSLSGWGLQMKTPLKMWPLLKLKINFFMPKSFERCLEKKNPEGKLRKKDEVYLKMPKEESSWKFSQVKELKGVNGTYKCQSISKQSLKKISRLEEISMLQKYFEEDLQERPFEESFKESKKEARW